MKKRNASKFNKAKEKSCAESVLWGGLKSLALSIAMLSALLFIGAAVAMSTSDPDILCAPLGYLVTFLTLFFSGIFAAKFCKNSPVLCALATGVTLSLIAVTANFCLGEGKHSLLELGFILFPVISVLGGKIAHGNKSKSRGKFQKR